MNDPRFGSQGTGRQTRGGLTSLGKGDRRKRAIRKKFKMLLMGVAMGSTHIPSQPVSASSQHNNRHQHICKSNTRSKRDIERVTTKVDFAFVVVLMEFITGTKSLDESMSDEMCHLVTYFRRVLISKGNMFKAINQTLETEDEEMLDSISKVAKLAGKCTARYENANGSVDVSGCGGNDTKTNGQVVDAGFTYFREGATEQHPQKSSKSSTKLAW
ncbi:Concanavalin A-like lectin/glucanase, subgroup [Artemisia annua]|uniref:Concanavalin A-like lectin/glucanase, subgroup n=1 Tax=Artemisia annua TaxID=35608 RepID=A0A2U1KK40_ARTAN|nr:Concanavalin A-like lectin/glucanase, subgroup [Artemisia annua]